MNTSERNKRIVSIILFFLFVALIFCEYLCEYYSVSVYVLAATTSATDVLDDLKADSKFSASDFPVVLGDYSLQVITLAESLDSELFVYVYQPSGEEKDFTASSINISTNDVSASTANDTIRYYNYKLIKLSSNGTLYKYLVEDFTVTSDEKRYYSISSIYRPFNSEIDEQADYDNKISEMSYSVSKEWCIATEDGETVIESVDIETITITDKFVGFVRYQGGVELSAGAFLGGITASECDCHFVAFNTDKDIDKLLEADIYYNSQTFMEGSKTSMPSEYGDVEENYAYLTYTQVGSYIGEGLFPSSYTWNRIQTVEDFLAGDSLKGTVYEGFLINLGTETELTDEGKEALEGKKWMVFFAETEHSYNASTEYFNGTHVTDVTILRLKFISDGITYNLGVIDNKQTGSEEPSNTDITKLTIEVGEDLKNLGRWISIVLLVIAGLVFVLIISKLISVASNASTDRKVDEMYKNSKGKIKKRSGRKKKK